MTFRTNRRRGFTAVEIAMVATVIAILALLILPIFRQRAEDARRVAAEDELASMVKALLLIEADVGDLLPRLSDLDNPDDNPPRYKWNPDRFGIGGPADYWVRMDDIERNNLLGEWRGPYAAVKTYAFRAELDGTDTGFVDPTLIDPGAGALGPVFFDAGDDPEEERYPVDPWGNPYLLFGPETDYNIRAIYSLGADRLPGAGFTAPQDFSDRTILGTGDDFEFLF